MSLAMQGVQRFLFLAREFAQLTKPGILRLLVITQFCTMLVAAGGVPDVWTAIWATVGTVMICGSANTINMVWDQDIDGLMGRTAHRPLVVGSIKPVHALIFSGALGLSAVLILTFLVNPLAALMGIAGHAYYAVIYTMWLKRSTPQNIVIGGAAGAFPALIGWAAVTGELSVTAWLIFAIVFFWTPPHFWALALYKDVEYGKANVPMMPNVRGHHTTKLQMLVYMLLLLGTSLALSLTGDLGLIYLVAAVVLGAGFTYCCIRAAFDTSDYWAKRTFAFSIIYLGLLFAAMSFDSLQTHYFTERHYLAAIERDADRIRAEQDIDEIRRLHNAASAPVLTSTP
ncbi:protoheme IX farnesyltransferase [Bradymonadaceae bacterium TMQ3]|uniref:Protoheme IX farnesyltransferase n=2 Tax=Lujinxingia sediminis TaxID=2480984 RepID=A0ABY0CSI1_9DELT|nr:protoheme IX farnesyltransferase [Bradymonadaceae bacterium TMQ3]RVU44064.1 protoheme IX farnesyltransferase [Lujinxingia sediminis]TXC76398.1 protoheme IX farnesyltransferase [Bradymonadales bacterium TMQ1]